MILQSLAFLWYCSGCSSHPCCLPDEPSCLPHGGHLFLAVAPLFWQSLTTFLRIDFHTLQRLRGAQKTRDIILMDHHDATPFPDLAGRDLLSRKPPVDGLDRDVADLCQLPNTEEGRRRDLLAMRAAGLDGGALAARNAAVRSNTFHVT